MQIKPVALAALGALVSDACARAQGSTPAGADHDAPAASKLAKAR